MIRIYAVTVCHAEIVQDTDAVDQHILTADKMGRPESASGECDPGQGEMADMLHEDKRHSRIEPAVDMVGGHSAVEQLLVSVDDAVSRNRDILAVLRIEEVESGHAGIIAVLVGGCAGFGGAGAVQSEDIIILEVIASLQDSSRLEVKLGVRGQNQCAGAVSLSTAQNDAAAAVFMAVVDGGLNCRSVVVGAVAEGTVVVYIVYHGVSCLHDRAKNLVNLTVAYGKSMVKPKYSAACGSVTGRQSTGKIIVHNRQKVS